MPINRIVATPRAKKALLGAVSAVALATTVLIQPWEGRKLFSYRDVIGVWTACDGETRGIRPGMKFTNAQCDDMTARRVAADFYQPLVACIPGFTGMPVSLQASFISGAYNHGAPSMCRSTARHLAMRGDYRGACIAATAFNKAGGRIWDGLVKRREMGDAQRIGEAELCVSGL
jgi:lysozyme